MAKSTRLYIDLGTANTLIYLRGRGLVLNEPSFLTVRNEGQSDEEMIAVGRDAKMMFGRTPSNLSVFRPMKEGVVADFDRAVMMLRGFIDRIRRLFSFGKPRVVISLPCRVTQAERNAVEEVARSVGAVDVRLIQEPVAAAIGAGLPILKPTGSMIVDIGGGTSEIAVISCGGIVYSNAARIGGDHMDEAIIQYVRQRYNFQIGYHVAEDLKIAMADALLPTTDIAIAVKGNDLNTGLPCKREITALDIHRAIDPTLRVIFQAIHDALDNTPPELAGDLAQSGMLLAGGGALIKNIDARVMKEFGVLARVSEAPLMSIGEGGHRALDSETLLEQIAI